MKIGFTVDTNILEGSTSENTGFLKNLSFFKDYIATTAKKNKTNELTFYLTDIVKEEVLSHKKLKMKEEYDKFVGQYKKIKYMTEGQLPTNKANEIIKKEKETVEDIKILKLNTSSKTFKKVIDRCLKQEPPFVKEHKDAGFKDALIWETILNSDEIDSLDKFYLFTCDKVFLSKKLEDEFEKSHQKVKLSIKSVEPNDEKREKVLNTLIEENNLIQTDIIKLFNKEKILKYINILGVKETELKDVKIIYSKFNIYDFDIVDVIEKSKNKFNVIINLHTDKIESPEQKILNGDLILEMELTTNGNYKIANEKLKNISYESYYNFITNNNYINENYTIPYEFNTRNSISDRINVQTELNPLIENNMYNLPNPTQEISSFQIFQNEIYPYRNIFQIWKD